MNSSTPRQCLTVTAAMLALSLSACRQVATAFGPTIPEARANGEDFFTSAAERYINVDRGTSFNHARTRFGRYALVPSNLYNDSSVWTAWARDSTRSLMVSAGFENNRYTYVMRATPSPISDLADARHYFGLRKLSGSEYEWITQVDFAIGRITAGDVPNVVSQLLASAEGRPVAAIRADYRGSFPRAAASLGRIFSVDSLRTVNDGEGATTTLLGIQLRPKGVQRSLPAFSKFLDKYVTPAAYRITVTDRQGGRWLEVRGDDNLMTVLVRSRGGHFAPLNGAVREIPDTLQMRSDFTTKILLFTVGYRNLINDLYVQRSDHEIGWLMRFQKEPNWKLPPAVGMMINAPLKRPFIKGGSVFRIAVRDTPGGQTLITRRTTGVVQESAILRFLNRFSGAMMGDFEGTAEAEENRFNAEAFTALRNDLTALLR